MRITSQFERFWPNTTRLLREQLPKYAMNPAAIEAFRLYAQMDAAALKEALRPGSPPQVELTGRTERMHGVYYCSDNGFTRDRLFVNPATLMLFEKQPSSACYAELVLATVLHELSHWGDCRDGLQFEWEHRHVMRDDAEAGDEIERMIFGRVVACQIASSNAR